MNETVMNQTTFVVPSVSFQMPFKLMLNWWRSRAFETSESNLLFWIWEFVSKYDTLTRSQDRYMYNGPLNMKIDIIMLRFHLLMPFRKLSSQLNYMYDELWKQFSVIFVESQFSTTVSNFFGSWEIINIDWLHKIVNTFTKWTQQVSETTPMW